MVHDGAMDDQEVEIDTWLLVWSMFHDVIVPESVDGGILLSSPSIPGGVIRVINEAGGGGEDSLAVIPVGGRANLRFEAATTLAPAALVLARLQPAQRDRLRTLAAAAPFLLAAPVSR